MVGRFSEKPHFEMLAEGDGECRNLFRQSVPEVDLSFTAHVRDGAFRHG